MTEDVLISVLGLHQTEDQDLEDLEAEEDSGQDIEVFSAGKYYLKNGKHYILYEEAIEGTTETVKNRITFRDGCLEVQKKGAYSVNMVFDRKQKHESWYTTPYGTILAGITVTDMNILEQEDLLEIYVAYGLDLNGQHAADSTIRIRVMAKGSSHFRLR